MTPEQLIAAEARRDHIAYMMEYEAKAVQTGRGERWFIRVGGPIPAWAWPQGSAPRLPHYATIRKYDAPRPGGWMVKANCPKDYRPRWFVLIWGVDRNDLEVNYSTWVELCENNGGEFA